ncbi:MAG: FAD-dependent oxidoreductase [Phycisphaerales bacterium]|jgi:glycerol-3-phosphate dehydrogenase|nr:FAD-dependent oxidoreductase [Phycisphaerales bacterium]
MSDQLAQLDALIVGGGISGLLTLEALHAKGCSAWLVEHRALGCGQTIWSQGIIHGGLKYALGGVAGAAARSVSGMPERWRSMLEGLAAPNLSGVALRADACAIWPWTSASSLAGLLAAKLALQTRPTRWAANERPPALAKIAGQVLRVAEPVLEPASLLRVLGSMHASRLLLGHVQGCRESERHVEVEVALGDHTIQIEAGHLVFLAGGGNAALRTMAGVDEVAMQTRGLRMVLARGSLPVLNGHCIRGTRPWLTITTAAHEADHRVWQIGGELAEWGATRSPADTIARAAAEVAQALPGVSMEGAQWSTYEAPRAEHVTAGGRRPDLPTVLEEGRVLTGWPTKLALAPLLADDIASRIAPRHPAAPVPPHVQRPGVATPPWMESCRWITAPSDAPA